MDKDMKAVLGKAVENNQSPAPGYALDELSRLTVTHTQICNELADRLLKSTKSGSTHVKLKALRAIHFIARRGSVHFRRACCHRMEELRPLLRATGKPDPIHGDAPWAMIRGTAKECMAVVHDTSNDDKPAMSQMKKMEGFGGGDGGGRAQDEFRNGTTTARNSGGGIGGASAMPNATSGVDAAKKFGASLGAFGKKTLQKAKEAAGVPDANQKYPQHVPEQTRTPDTYNDGWGVPTSQVMSDMEEKKSAAPKTIRVEAGEYETKLVDDFCEPSGARPIPTKPAINEFVKKCSALETNLVCALLEDKLVIEDEDDWKYCLRAVYGIEGLASSGKEGVAEFFEDDLTIQGLVNSPQSSLKKAAEKCLRTFQNMKAPAVDMGGMGDMFSGMDMGMTMGGGPAPVAADLGDISFGGSAPPPTADLGDISFGAAVVPGSSPALAPAPTPQLAAVDLMGGFGAPVQAQQPAPAATPAVDLMGMFAAPTPTPTPAPQQAAGGFGFQQQAPAPAAGGFGAFGAPQQAAPPQQPAAGGFGFGAQPAATPGFGAQQPAQMGFGQPAAQQPMGFGQPAAAQGGFGQFGAQPPQQAGFGAPQPGFGVQPQQGGFGFGAPQQAPQGFGAPQQAPQGFGAPQQAPQAGFGFGQPPASGGGAFDFLSK